MAALSGTYNATSFAERWAELMKCSSFVSSLARVASADLAAALAEAALCGAAPPAALHRALFGAMQVSWSLVEGLEATGAIGGRPAEVVQASILRELARGVAALPLEEATGKGQFCPASLAREE